jgi:ankyrin repeat protein
MTGLTAACDNMKVRTATTLLELGANPNVITKVRAMADVSFEACTVGYCARVVWSQAGWTPLMYAVSRGCTPIILALISANADVNFADKVCFYHHTA